MPGHFMRYVLPLFCLLVAFPFDAGAEDATVRYEQLAATARRGDQPVDWQALRFAYAETPHFDVLGATTSTLRKPMFEAYAKRDYAGALAEAQRLLDENYTDIAAHMISDHAYHYLGDDTRARQEREIAVALMRSFGTGNGRSAAEGLTVISITEEYDFLHYLGYEVKVQALVTEAGHAYDRFEVERDGQPYAIYFLVDRVLAAEDAMFEPKP